MIHGNTTDQQLTGMVTVYAQLLVKSREQKQSITTHIKRLTGRKEAF